MDLLLPAELLAQIASFLSKKDCNGLSRTSKTAQIKLSSYRNLLPKAETNVTISSSRGKVYFETRTESRGRRRVEIIAPPNELMETDEENVYAELLEYYRKEIDISQDRNIYKLHGDGLAVLLKLIFNNFSVKSLNLCRTLPDSYFNADVCLDLTRLVTKNRWNVKDLVVVVEQFSECLMDFILACNPRKLFLTGKRLPRGFYQAEVARKLSHLCINIENNSMNDHYLLSLNVPNFFLYTSTNITVQGILTLVDEWTQSKQEISIYFVILQTWRAITIEEWQAKFVERNHNNLFELTVIQKEYKQTLELKRRSDGLVLRFEAVSEGAITFMKLKY